MSVFGEMSQDNLQFMIDNYGLSQEELAGIDLERLIDDYQLRSVSYTPDQIRQILADEGDMYVDDGTTALFSIFSVPGRDMGLDEKDVTERIGLYINSGTLIQRMVFDLKNNQYYVDNADPHQLSEEKVEELRQLHKKWNLSNWNKHTEGVEEPSTGNYSWKLVFQLANGEFVVYDGYTKDMTHLPDHFEEVRDTLYSVMQ